MLLGKLESYESEMQCAAEEIIEGHRLILPGPNRSRGVDKRAGDHGLEGPNHKKNRGEADGAPMAYALGGDCLSASVSLTARRPQSTVQ